MQGKIESAERSYMRALEASGFPISDFKAQNITTTYNLARIKEVQYKYEEAEQMYKGILKEHPNYIDCNCETPFLLPKATSGWDAWPKLGDSSTRPRSGSRTPS